MDPKFQKWQRWIEAIYEELQGVLVQRHIFWEVQEIIKANPSIQKSSAFYGFLGNAYASLGLTAVRRLTKNQKDSVSLTGLLLDIQQNPEVLCEENYRALFSAGSLGPIGGEFGRICEGTVNNHIDPAVPANEVDEIRHKSKSLEDFVDKKVAHLDRRALTGGVSSPTFNELDQCLDYLEKLVLKYYLLLTAICSTSATPTFQYDWQEIFTEPWIQQ